MKIRSRSKFTIKYVKQTIKRCDLDLKRENLKKYHQLVSKQMQIESDQRGKFPVLHSNITLQIQRLRFLQKVYIFYNTMFVQFHG